MTRDDIITELSKHGCKASPYEVTKNSVKLNAIRIDNGSRFNPVVYTDSIIADAEKTHASVTAAADRILSVCRDAKVPDFDINLMHDRDFVSEHLYLALQKSSSEELVRAECGITGYEAYVHLRHSTSFGTNFSIKLSRKMLEDIGMDASEAADIALAHTLAETELISISDMIGTPCRPAETNPRRNSSAADAMYTLTNKCRFKGASALLDKSALMRYGELYHTESLLVIPSSIHEVLLLPYSDDTDIPKIERMIQNTNAAIVDPCDRLSDKPIIIDLWDF